MTSRNADVVSASASVIIAVVASRNVSLTSTKTSIVLYAAQATVWDVYIN